MCLASEKPRLAANRRGGNGAESLAEDAGNTSYTAQELFDHALCYSAVLLGKNVKPIGLAGQSVREAVVMASDCQALLVLVPAM